MSGIGKPFGEMLKSYGIYLNGGAETNFFGYIGGRKVRNAGPGRRHARRRPRPEADVRHSRVEPPSTSVPTTTVGARTPPASSAVASSAPQALWSPGQLSSWANCRRDQDLLNDHIAQYHRVGRIADNIDFSGSELYCRYLFSICGNLFNAWYFNDNNPSYPVATWGGRVTIKPSLTTYFRFGAYQETSVQAANAAFGKSFDFGHDVGVFIPVEIGYKTGFDQDPFPRGFYVGGRYDSSKFTDPMGKLDRGRSAVYFGMQQMIFRPDMNSHRGVTVFGGAFLDTSNAGPVSTDISMGMSPGRPDAFGGWPTS